MNRLDLSSKLRFAMVGGFCAVLHNALVIAGHRAGLHYAIAAVAGFGLVAAAGYLLHAAFTFREAPSFAAFFRYAGAMTTNLPIFVALMWVQCDLLGVPVAAATVIATGLMVVWNYLISRWAILKPAGQAR